MHIALHTTQLYSSLLLFIIFLSMYFVFQKIVKKPGQLICIYLILASMERFAVDFWRGDRIFFNQNSLSLMLTRTFSIHQLIAVGIFVTTGILFMYISTINIKQYE